MVRPQLHATALTTQCGEAFRRRYVEGEIIPPGVAMVVGTATDRSVSQNLQEKIDRGTLLEVTAVADAARDGLEAAWAGGVTLTDEEAAHGLRKVKGEAADKAVRLATLHAQRVAPRLSPLRVQRAWSLTIPGYPLDVVGTLDIQEPTTIRDTKTAARAPADDAAETSVQLTAYHLAVTVLDGKAPAAVALDYLVDSKPPKPVSLSATRGPEDYRALLARVEVWTKALETGTFTPVTPDHWICSPRWCGYYSTCRYVRRPVAVGF